MDNPSSEDIARVIARMTEARWVLRSLVTPVPIKIDLTKLGEKRFAQLYSIITELRLATFTEAEMGALLGLIVAARDAER